MKEKEVIKLIIDAHKAKFQNVTWQTQILKVTEEKMEAKEELNRSIENYQAELLDVAIASIGLMRFKETELIGYDMLWNTFEKTDIIYDTFWDVLYNHWKKIEERVYFENNGVYHH